MMPDSIFAGASGTDQTLQLWLYTLGTPIEPPPVGAPPSARWTRGAAAWPPAYRGEGAALHVARAERGASTLIKCKANWSLP